VCVARPDLGGVLDGLGKVVVGGPHARVLACARTPHHNTVATLGIQYEKTSGRNRT
jgi:hypothetical protein